VAPTPDIYCLSRFDEADFALNWKRDALPVCPFSFVLWAGSPSGNKANKPGNRSLLVRDPLRRLCIFSTPFLLLGDTAKNWLDRCHNNSIHALAVLRRSATHVPESFLGRILDFEGY